MEARPLPVPRADWATPTPRFKNRAERRAPLRKPQAPRSGAGAARGGRGHGPGATRQGVVPKPQPRPLRARKEAAAKVGATGRPRVRLTCGRARPRLLSSERGLRGEGADLPVLPARRPPQGFHAAVAATQPPGAGAQAHRVPLTPALRASSPFSSFPARVPGLERVASPPTLPNSGTRSERAATAGREGRCPPPGAWGARGPRAASAARRALTQPAPLGARAAEDAGGLPRPRPALPPGRAPAAPLAAPPLPRPSGGEREGSGRAAHAGPASRSPRGGHPEFSSLRRLLLPIAVGRLWLRRGSPAPVLAGSPA